MKEQCSYYHPLGSSECGELKPLSALAKSLEMGGVYEHYKGRRYQLISIGRNSETLEEVVIYRALYGDRDVWMRPLSMFVENVEIEGESVPRFKKILGSSDEFSDSYFSGFP
ncbi:MAG: DUF1653 domain-containing protein [Chlamydiales bacterium]